MYLKKIEVKGFKSFADRTAVKPAFGVTCVVGPNGSGKSNITDAIRWVLGEQGARVLRGEKMEDIIFSGTGKRASLGFAEVRLTLDNSDGALKYDFHEVEVSRRLYRSGESEYRINDAAVRLRDIRDLFADTGVGLEGYSIIGQGRIDEIVGASPQERRLLFDEAAGVTAYKAKKAEAEKQLKAAEADLREISVRMDEAEMTIDSLKREAERAKIHLEISGIVREIRIAEYVELYQDISLRLEKSKQKYGESKARQDEIIRQRERCERELDAREIRLTESRERLRSADRERYELSGRIRAADTEILLADEKRHGLEKQLKTLIQKKEYDVQHHGEAVEHRLLLERDLAEMERRTEEYEERIGKSAADMGLHTEKLSSLKRNVDTLQKEELMHRSDWELSNIRKAECEKQLRSLSQDSGDVQDFIRRESELEMLRMQFEDSREDHGRKRKDLHLLEEELKNIRAEIASHEKERIRLKAELDFHKDGLETFHDYEQAVQAIMRTKPEDILGVVGELFRVDKKYEEAIETALGRNIGILVCERAETAKRYIEALRKNKGGRVSFLPLEDAGEYEPFEAEGEGLEGTAFDLIRFEPRYENVFRVLLGNILIASDFEAGRRLLQFGKRVVTLKGEVFIPGGIITGGGTRGGRILSRRRIALECEEKLEDLDRLLDRLEERETERAQEGMRLKREAAESESLVSGIQLRLALAESDFNKEKREMEARKRHFHDETARLESELDEIAKRMEGIREKAEFAKRRSHEDQAALRDLERMFSEKSDALTEQKIEFARLKEQLIGKRKETERLSGEIAKLERESRQLHHDIAGVQKELEETEEIREEKMRMKRGMLPVFEQLNTERSQMEEEVNALSEESAALSANAKELDAQIRRAEERSARFQTECIRSESELSRIQSELIGIYEIGMDEAVGATTTVPREERKEVLLRCQKELQDLGSVNISSIEEYRLRMERMERIGKEREEIERAVHATVQLIEGMSDEIDQRFREGLHSIAASFDRAFSRLFGGGEARLRVVADEDPLNSGVEIVVQPPGKKLRSLSLLSGGEKALTAIALLFAFMEQRPSPFYVLDEIEAPLDDVNLAKFTEFLKEYSEKAQFLVITHRRATMEIADAVFGVTMEEYGVSKVISAKMEMEKSSPLS